MTTPQRVLLNGTLLAATAVLTSPALAQGLLDPLPKVETSSP
jgi:hypothetical protein